MSATKTRTNQWTAETMDPPNLSQRQWNLSMLLGLVFLAMAVCQLATFTDFRMVLGSFNITNTATWAVCIILAEVWAAAGFFKLRLSYFLRIVSATLAVLVSGFWFIESLRIVSSGNASSLANNGFFGRLLAQSPGWWTVVESTILLFWVIYILELSKDSLMPKRR